MGRPLHEFWTSTLHEFNAIHDGFLEARGLAPDQTQEPLSRAEMNRLIARRGCRGAVVG